MILINKKYLYDWYNGASIAVVCPSIFAKSSATSSSSFWPSRKSSSFVNSTQLNMLCRALSLGFISARPNVVNSNLDIVSLGSKHGKSQSTSPSSSVKYKPYLVISSLKTSKNQGSLYRLNINWTTQTTTEFFRVITLKGDLGVHLHIYSKLIQWILALLP